jgi:hypothetical protein
LFPSLLLLEDVGVVFVLLSVLFASFFSWLFRALAARCFHSFLHFFNRAFFFIFLVILF